MTARETPERIADLEQAIEALPERERDEVAAAVERMRAAGEALLGRVKELEAKGAPIYFVMPDGSSYIEGRGYRVAIVIAGEDGFRWTGRWPNDGTGVMPYFWGPTLAAAQRRAAKQNARIGITEEEATLIVLRSMGRSTPCSRRRRRP